MDKFVFLGDGWMVDTYLSLSSAEECDDMCLSGAWHRNILGLFLLKDCTPYMYKFMFTFLYKESVLYTLLSRV